MSGRRTLVDLAAILATVAVGAWLLALPSLVEVPDAGRASHLVVGPVIMSVGIVSLSGVTRTLVRVDLALGAWLLVAPLLLPHGPVAAASSVVAGVLVGLLALVPEGRPEQYGGGWSSLFR